MEIKRTDNISFGYTHKLKTLYKKGKLPSVKYGFYGDELTPKSVTLEHLQCISKGGKTELDNLVLASANKNQERGNSPLFSMLNWKYAGQYLEQFRDVVVDGFNGNAYIQAVLDKVKYLLEAGL